MVPNDCKIVPFVSSGCLSLGDLGNGTIVITATKYTVPTTNVWKSGYTGNSMDGIDSILILYNYIPPLEALVEYWINDDLCMLGVHEGTFHWQYVNGCKWNSIQKVRDLH